MTNDIEDEDEADDRNLILDLIYSDQLTDDIENENDADDKADDSADDDVG